MLDLLDLIRHACCPCKQQPKSSRLPQTSQDLGCYLHESSAQHCRSISLQIGKELLLSSPILCGCNLKDPVCHAYLPHPDSNQHDCADIMKVWKALGIMKGDLSNLPAYCHVLKIICLCAECCCLSLCSALPFCQTCAACRVIVTEHMQLGHTPHNVENPQTGDQAVINCHSAPPLHVTPLHPPAQSPAPHASHPSWVLQRPHRKPSQHSTRPLRSAKRPEPAC